MSTTRTTRTVSTFDAEGKLLTTQKVEEVVESSDHHPIKDFMDQYSALPPHVQRAIQRQSPGPSPRTEAEVNAIKNNPGETQ